MTPTKNTPPLNEEWLDFVYKRDGYSIPIRSIYESLTPIEKEAFAEWFKAAIHTHYREEVGRIGNAQPDSQPKDSKSLPLTRESLGELMLEYVNSYTKVYNGKEVNLHISVIKNFALFLLDRLAPANDMVATDHADSEDSSNPPKPPQGGR